MKLKYKIATAASIILAAATAIPGHAHKLNPLGYNSICSFTPYSTAILIVLAAIILIVGKGRATKKAEPNVEPVTN